VRLGSVFRSPQTEIVARPQRTPREELRRQQRLRTAMRSDIPEIPRDELTAGRFGSVQHKDGRRFQIVRGEVDDARHSPVVAFYVTATGDVVFLEALR
jgi:hypothetical protein